MTHSHLRVPLLGTVLLFTALLLVAATSPAMALKPGHEADRLILAAEEAIAANNYSQAAEHLEKARQLGISLPAEYDFFQGKLLHQRDEPARARSHLESYADQAGSGGEYYREALSLITDIEQQRSQAKQGATGSAEGTAELSWADNQRHYVEEIQELYKSSDASKALIQHINNLLKFYAYGDERIIAASRMATPSRHRIHTSDRGEIVSFSKFGLAEDEPFREKRFTVYGIDPYVEHQCDRSSASCWVLHPVTSERWLQIVQNEDVAAELSKAFSQLIKRMQKG